MTSSTPHALLSPEFITSHQPKNIIYPKIPFGKTNITLRSFKPSWYEIWSWLHCNESTERVFCYLCISAYKQNKLRSTNIDPAFITKGFQNWKDATLAFSKHESSTCHKEAVEQIITLPATNLDIGECISSDLAKEKLENRGCFLKVISTIQFLARQALPICGDGAGELDGNFNQLLQLRIRDDDSGLLDKWLKQKSSKYTSHDIQNEMLQIMSLNLLRKISQDLQSSKFVIMVDETTDISTKEQVVLVFRWVDSNLNVHEKFVGLYMTDSIASDPLVYIIKDVMLRLNLKFENCRGQCYDGANNMRGCKNGVAKQILDIEPRAIYTHCYGHAINLACQDTIRNVKIIKNALDTIFEISKLLKYSSRRNALYLKIKVELILDFVHYVQLEGQ